MATVDGVTVAPNSHGVIQGDGGTKDKISGGAGNDYMQGQAAFNQYNGGAGGDTFIINAKFADQSGAFQGSSTAFANQFAYITDFQGAGVAGGDQIAFDGFDALSLSLIKTTTSGTAGAVVYVYSVTSETGNVYNFTINSLNGDALTSADFNFY